MVLINAKKAIGRFNNSVYYQLQFLFELRGTIFDTSSLRQAPLLIINRPRNLMLNRPMAFRYMYIPASDCMEAYFFGNIKGLYVTV